MIPQPVPPGASPAQVTPSAPELARLAQAATMATPVPSPCRDVCTMDPASGYCLGCLRTIDEIAGWSAYDDAGKRRVWSTLPARAAFLAGEAMP